MKLARLPDGTPEIFHTLQGEGASVGSPAVFIRASRCNLHCVWCDTDYTWNWEGTDFRHERDAEPGYRKFLRAEQTVEIEPAEVARLVSGYACDRLVLTGGEPLMQVAGWVEMLAELERAGRRYTVEVETNGTLLPGALDQYISQYNVSPKLGNSGNPERLRIKPETLAWFATTPKAWFKFVVGSPGDLGEVEQLIAEHGLPRAQVILMPQARSPEALAAARIWLADACRGAGFRFGDRLHLELWGPARGR